MSTAIYPGSFDPVTLGHMDIISRSSKIFDRVVVCILNNSTKKTPLFSRSERVNMLNDVVKKFGNVEVMQYDGLLVDFAKENNISIIVRGLREITDFDSELQMAQGNHMVSPDIETIFLATDPRFSFISSSMVREFASYGKSVKGFVPEEILPLIEAKVEINQ
ncbi:MAG: pantetheine-phosphate adenylyltransferase [Eubacterium sp.]|nr:pantetheine-phosphate adenylyltransferase [Eubacterium sp.]